LYRVIEKPDGLCCKLTRPCARNKPVIWDLSRAARDKWEIDRDSLEFRERLGAGQFGEVWKGEDNIYLYTNLNNLN